MGLGCGWGHDRKQWAGDFDDFEKKQFVDIRSWTKRVDFWAGRGQSSCVLRDAPNVVGLDGTVSIVKIVPLSPCVKKTKSQKCNKSFVPEPRELSVFWDSYAYECFTYMYILHIRLFAYFTYLYFTYTTQKLLISIE